jgi:hypothetical protein
MIEPVVRNHTRTQKSAPSGIATLTASLVIFPPLAIVPFADPPNSTCVNVPAGYSIEAETVADDPGLVSSRVDRYSQYQLGSTNCSEEILARAR